MPSMVQMESWECRIRHLSLPTAFSIINDSTIQTHMQVLPGTIQEETIVTLSPNGLVLAGHHLATV